MSLRFGERVPDIVRARIEHAFRSFCVVYGFQPSRGSGVRLVYGAPASAGELELPAGYTPRMGDSRRTPPHLYQRAGLFADGEPDTFPCFHVVPGGRSPDWLGEIFEWIGGEAERITDLADAVGRLPFPATLHGQHGLDPEVPYAAVAMRGLNQDIAAHAGPRWPERPAPWPGVDGVAIVATHDLDFLPVSAWGSLAREVKNAAIAAIVHRDPGLVLQIVLAICRGAVRGRAPLDTLAVMVDRERALGIRSACYVICSKEHRRDANYRIDNPSVHEALAQLARAGSEIGVHGSYTSLAVPGRLKQEYDRLRAVGFHPRGGRQHWLRFRDGGLFDALTESGAEYDCSVGHADRIGFRSGACFPFVPWNFASEDPFPLLEIPLVVMDVSLYAQFRRAAGEAERRTRRLLRRASLYGGGGISLLWHNTVYDGAQLPMPLSELYWRLKEPGQVWMTGAELIDAARPRFAQAGLVRGG